MIKDDLFDKITAVILITNGVFVIILLIGIIIYMFQPNKNCHYEMYMQYPCEGATHYARVHRNYNEPCERYKKVCELSGDEEC